MIDEAEQSSAPGGKAFQKRNLALPNTLGERLHQLREESRIPLEELAQELRVPPKYLEAIERTEYSKLPGLVYARNFVRLYATRMQLNVETAMEKFEEEYKVIQSAAGIKRPLMVARAKTEHPWYRRHARIVAAGGGVILVLMYFGWQVYRLITPPALVITQPAGDISTKERRITIAGTSQPETTIQINNQDIEVAGNGTFSETIDIHPGLNTLKITAKKKFSQQRVVFRQVLGE